jgi:large subunit ribosomal protein L22
MEKQAVAKYIHISAYKAREITRLIQRKPVNEALALVDFTPSKAGHLVGKVLRSAIANIENNPDVNISKDDMFVKEAVVGEGPTIKRFRPRARGTAAKIRKRTSHIKVIVASNSKSG